MAKWIIYAEVEAPDSASAWDHARNLPGGFTYEDLSARPWLNSFEVTEDIDPAAGERPLNGKYIQTVEWRRDN